MNRISPLAQAFSRRGVLGATAAGAAVAVGTSAPAQAVDGIYDCVVVGAGLSGLGAALKLREAGKSVLVVEARDRAGGRVENVLTSGGTTIDGGAEFVGPTQNKIAALAAKYGVATQPTYNTGANIYWREGTATKYCPDIGFPLDSAIGELAVDVILLGTLAASVTPGKPWEHPLAWYYDSITYQQWIDWHASSASGRLQLRLLATTILSIDPSKISMLFLLNYIASAGGPGQIGTVFRLLNVKDGAQERFFEGGAALVPLRAAADLGPSVVYNAPVSAINQSWGVASVVTPVGTFKGKRVIVAMSPAISGRIAYNPGVSTARAKLHTQMKMGSIGKFMAVYDTPFWRTDGWTGQVIGDGDPIDVTFESYGEGKHILMGFLSDNKMRALDSASPAVLTAKCLDMLERYFGHRVKTDVRETGFKRWDNDPYSWGGPTGVAPTGLLTSAGRALRDTTGLIHWAGTESAIYWQGYMDGALDAGYRAAAEVIAAT